jgi:hypothetical protein
MPTTFESVPELMYLTLKVLEEYDEDHKTWVATCLETGAVAAAPDPATLRKLMDENIQLEILLAIKRNDFANLFRKSASGEVKARWYRAAGMTTVLDQYKLEINIHLSPPRREVTSEKIGIEVAKVDNRRTA